jgi:hypothetical protein
LVAFAASLEDRGSPPHSHHAPLARFGIPHDDWQRAAHAIGDDLVAAGLIALSVATIETLTRPEAPYRLRALGCVESNAIETWRAKSKDKPTVPRMKVTEKNGKQEVFPD